MDKNQRLTHLNEEGEPRIVDLSNKPNSGRVAQAHGWVLLSPNSLALIENKEIQKGDVLQIAQLAGICGAKKTSDIIPLCHPIPIDAVDVRIRIVSGKGVHIVSEVRNYWKTGVEMEALMAVSSAALCVYDMVKAVDREAKIDGIALLYKKGGKTGEWGKYHKMEQKS